MSLPVPRESHDEIEPEARTEAASEPLDRHSGHPAPRGDLASAFRRNWLFLSIICLIGLSIRLDFLVSNNFVIDADEAIVGLMAKHFLEGNGLPVFYYGQHYMGSFEPLLVSGVFAIFGISSAGLQSVPLAFSIALIPLIFAIAFEVSNVRVARLASLLAAIPPTSLVVWSGKARGGFLEIVFIGALAIWLTVVWLRASHPKPALTGLVWLTLGFGWWVNNQVIFFMLPIAFFMGARVLGSPASARRWLEACGLAATSCCAFLIGGLPFWIYNIQNGMASFGMFHSAEGGDLLEHWQGLFSTALPIVLGARRFWDSSDIFPFASYGAWVVYGALAIFLIALRRREIAQLLRLRVDPGQPLELLGMFVICCLCVFACSSFGYLVQAPRYLLPAYVGIFVLTAWTIDRLSASSRALAALALASILSLNLLSSYYPRRAIPGEPFVELGERVAKDHSELIDWLTSRGHGWVRTNYWIGYRLAFESGERVRFLHGSHPYNVRIPSYAKDAEDEPLEHMPMVLVPAQARLIRAGLKAIGLSYEEITLSGYVVIHSVRPPKELHRLAPGQMRVDASHNPAAAPSAVDGDPNTRWGSAHPQVPGMVYRVRFPAARSIKGLEMTLADWASDFPRNLAIELILEDGSHQRLWSKDAYQGIMRYLEYGSPRFEKEVPFEVYVEPIKVLGFDLIQLGNHPILDWSISELSVYE